MRKINGKNKFLFFVFSLTILLVIILLLYATFSSKSNKNSDYVVSSNTVLFDENTQIIDTSDGGSISKKWNGSYIYNSNDTDFSLGKTPIIYEKASDNISLLSKSYFISESGDIKTLSNFKTNTNSKDLGIYKLEDRKYLIISSSIYTEDKTVLVNKFVVVFIDKRGNASLLNDAINVKTINPIKLIFDDCVFDVANEKLIHDEKEIDLKLVNGSTNEFVPFNSKEKNVNMVNFVNSYNKLVNDFNKYSSNNTLNVGSNNYVSNTTSNVVVNNSNGNGSNNGSGNNNNESNNNNATPATNRVPLNKMISLRGAVSGPNYIDVSYVVTDPEDKYQAVYLLVVGRIGDEDVTQKIILDKYNTVERVPNLSLSSEYTISLGYIESKSYKGEISLIDEIEDVINVRTKKSGATIAVDKISGGYVYFTYKMNSMYAYDEGIINLYADDEYVSGIAFNYEEAISGAGFKSKLKLIDGKIFTLKTESLVFNGNESSDVIKVKFTY